MAPTRCGGSAPGALVLRNPTTGIAGCCARAASGQAAALPSATSNSRRPMVTVIRPPCEVRKGNDTTSRAYSLAVQGGLLLPPPALRERRHRGLARRGVAVRRHTVLVLAEGERPHSGRNPPARRRPS